MDATADELAGVVDLFGGLTGSELERALAETAYRAGGQHVDEDAVAGAVEDALEAFALVEYDPEDGEADETLLVTGPTAFPRTPAHAEDLPHILDVEPRRPDREALGEQALDRFRDAVAAALADGDDDRSRDLLEASYDLEAWAPVDASDARSRLDAALDGDHVDGDREGIEDDRERSRATSAARTGTETESEAETGTESEAETETKSEAETETETTRRP